ncbi:hypothetical protein XthCFBP4691_05235 [Xanthomonas theicola]|uniref:Uncharacterized protein n=1 Tax=Xanthomonas theicola TaxID=56464 RepID=A0A2S6ZIH0_9XANT|nr:hypothetical protein XthCFBP4691_05235 [Xanthomonas theicola]
MQARSDSEIAKTDAWRDALSDALAGLDAVISATASPRTEAMPASVHDTTVFDAILDETHTRQDVRADRGEVKAARALALREQDDRDRIQGKGRKRRARTMERGPARWSWSLHCALSRRNVCWSRLGIAGRSNWRSND